MTGVVGLIAEEKRAMRMERRGRLWDGRACRDQDPELFFPLGGATRQIENAKKVCLRCPVRAECLQEALDSGHDDGVWGGLTDRERRLLHRRPAMNRAPTSKAQALFDAPGELLALTGSGLRPVEIATALGTTVPVVNTVLAALEAQDAGVES